MGTYREPLLDTALDRNKPSPNDSGSALDVTQYFEGQVSSPAMRKDGYGAGTVENNVPAVTPDFNWTNPTNAQGLEGGLYWNTNDAVLTTSGAQPYTCATLRFSNFGFSIPAGSTILGVECCIVIEFSQPDYDWNSVRLAWGASAANLSTNNNGTAAGAMPSGPNTTTGDAFWFGGSADLWGESSATLLSNVNTTDFGFVFQPARNDSPSTSSRVLNISSARMVVHYSVTEAGNMRVTQEIAQVVGEKAEAARVTQMWASVIGETQETTARNTRVSQVYGEVISTIANATPTRAFQPIVVT